MALARFIQSPSERKRYVIDYADWLSTGETVSSFTFTVSPTTAPAFIVNGTGLSLTNTDIIFFASGGVDGQNYKVEVFATTSIGEIKEDVILFDVRDP